MSKIVLVVEEIERFKRRKIEKWYPVLYVDGVCLRESAEVWKDILQELKERGLE